VYINNLAYQIAVEDLKIKLESHKCKQSQEREEREETQVLFLCTSSCI
jgi:hypothetical protein